MRYVAYGIVGFFLGGAVAFFIGFSGAADVFGFIGLIIGVILARSKGKAPRASHNYNTSDSMDTRLIGRWVGYPGGDKIEILFNLDGSFDSNMPFGGGSETFGVWRDKEGELLLTVETGHLAFRYSINGSTMNITNLKTNVSMEMSKV